jgi:hypothetical protein
MSVGAAKRGVVTANLAKKFGEAYVLTMSNYTHPRSWRPRLQGKAQKRRYVRFSPVLRYNFGSKMGEFKAPLGTSLSADAGYL